MCPYPVKHAPVYAKAKDTPENREKFAKLVASALRNIEALEAFTRAVSQIKVECLWTLEYETWEDFCEKALGFTKRRVDQQLTACRIMGELKSDEKLSQWIGGKNFSLPQPILTNESQLAALKDVPHQERDRVLQCARQTGRLTASTIKQAAKHLSSDAEVARQGARESLSMPIPPHVRETIEAGTSFAKAARHLRSAAGLLRGLISHDQGDGLDVTWPEKLSNFAETIAEMQPYSECPSCEGQGCKECGKRGWITKAAYSDCPEDVRRECRLVRPT
jgi:hypothetical protein